MPSELPWNVAGIAPEAREAARVSARREGLSVGEWLTRHILTDIDGDAGAADLRRAPAGSRFRSINETRSTGNRVENQLRGFARRLDQTERSQYESSRAMGRAASDIHAASRAQARALEQLATHATRFNERVARLEQKLSADVSREAIKALHHGLSRLAVQVTEIASRSAAQAEQLAAGIESLSGRLAESRSDPAARAQQDRIDVLTGRVGVIANIVETQGDVQHYHQELDQRIVALSERIRSAEKAALAGVDAIERALIEIEVSQSARKDEASEIRKHGAALSQLSQSLDSLNSRVSTNEERHSDEMVRLQAGLSKLEAGVTHDATDALLHEIVKSLAEISSRVEKIEHESAAFSDGLNKDLRELAARMDAAEKARAAPRVVEHPPMAETQLLRPFPNEQGSAAAPQRVAAAHERMDVRSGAGAMRAPQQSRASESVMALLRSARKSDHAQTTGARSESLFAWVTPHPEPEFGGGVFRVALAVGLAVLIVAAIAAGVTLSRSFYRVVPARAMHSRVALLTQSSPVRTSNRPAQPPGQAVTPKATISARTGEAAGARNKVIALANAGNAKAEELLGFEYLDGEGGTANEPEAAKWLERAAQKGEAFAAYRLATLYERGRGVPANPAKAVQWYGAAANAGNRIAMHNLALAFAQGAGVPKSPTLAAQWFARAAKLGLADSQFDLGVLYERGMGVPENLREAYRWYAIAAAQGDAESRARLDVLATEIGARERAAAEKAAAQFRPEPMNRDANVPPDAASVVGKLPDLNRRQNGG
ncbi:MAG TPA: hypothetical protein VGI20_07485 [Rhizomicrobium sp.]